MHTIKRIIQNAKEWRVHLIVATIALLLITGVNLVTPIAVDELFDLIAGDEDGAARTIWLMAGGLLGLYLLRVVFQFFNSYFAHIAAWKSVAKMRGRLYGHVQGLSPSFFSDKQTGQLMSRVVEDTANFEMLIAHTLPEIISAGLVFCGVLGIMLYLNPLLTLITCAPMPFIVFCSFFARRMRRHFSKRQIISAELNGMLQDNFSGVKEIQIFNRLDYEAERVTKKAGEHAGQTMKGLLWVAVMHPAITFLSGIGNLLVILFGGLFALQGNADAGELTAFLLYLGLLYAPVASVARIVEDIQNALVSGRRVFDMLDIESEVKEKPGAIDMPVGKGEVEFKNVSFSYESRGEKPKNPPDESRKKPEDAKTKPAAAENARMDVTPVAAVVKNVSFRAESGQMVALVGPTGAGKTTITSLLSRFYDPQEGSVLIDGTDIRDMTLASLRSQISAVMQDVFLFNGTIAENIAYGRTDEVSIEDIRRAAEAACVHEFIDSLPDKYDTRVGERGMRLSGGQKQRIALARAVLRESPVLILDEATSAIDNETEREIQSAINSLSGRRTLIVIAHRLSTIEKADLILVLADGEIVERGTHAELLEKGGTYTKMLRPEAKASIGR